ncbi:hypothetical protein LOZ58_001563 [Ophidiomyces ophidiicola]|nr:hypothetical protein LOZ58_001563 [Ophidiomyces ophidiicola]
MLLLLSPLFAVAALALRVTPGSPCERSCGSGFSNTTGDDIVCRDPQFFDSEEGIRFRECVNCELRSTYSISRAYDTDLKWGLYNLRFAFSSCIYAFPVAKQSLSTPCQVTCDSLQQSIKYDLMNPKPQSAYDFCGLDSFSDSFVTKCALCYSLTEDEKFLANFIEAIRQGCHSKVRPGMPFITNPDRIFNTTLLPASTQSVNPMANTPKGKKNLVLIIVLPIVGFLLISLLTCFCCFFFIRHRRRKAKRKSQIDIQNRWNHDAAMMSPVAGGFAQTWNQPVQQQYPAQTPQTPGYHPGFQATYYSPEQDVKYPPEAYQMGPVSHFPNDSKKADFVAPTVPILSAPPPGRKSLSNP